VTALLLVRWGTTSYTSITCKLQRQNIIINNNGIDNICHLFLSSPCLSAKVFYGFCISQPGQIYEHWAWSDQITCVVSYWGTLGWSWCSWAGLNIGTLHGCLRGQCPCMMTCRWRSHCHTCHCSPTGSWLMGKAQQLSPCKSSMQDQNNCKSVIGN